MSTRPLRHIQVQPQPDAAPGIALGVLLAEADGRWRVRLGTGEKMVGVDPTVDPALLREALRSGARVVLDTTDPEAPVVVGALVTGRALTIDRAGDVAAQVRRFKVTAAEEALLSAAGAFVRVAREDVELYGL